MSPTHAGAWWWLLLALPLWAAHVRWHRRRPLQVASTLLFRALAGPPFVPRRPTWEPRDPVGLALRTVALVALVLALADWRDPAHRGRDVVFVLDTSASMAAFEGPRTRLDLATTWIRQAARGIAPEDHMALVEAGPRARVRVPWTRDRGQLRQALHAVQPHPGPTALAEALSIAETLSRGRAGAVVLVSDGVGVTLLPPEGPSDATVQWQAVGTAKPNTGIVGLEATREDAFGQTTVTVAIERHAVTPEPATVELWAGERLLAVVALDLPAHGLATATRSVALGRGPAILEARLHLAEPDARPDDDVGRVLLDPMPPVRIAAADLPPALLTALRVHPAVQLAPRRSDSDDVLDPAAPVLHALAARAQADLSPSDLALAVAEAVEAVRPRPLREVWGNEALRPGETDLHPPPALAGAIPAAPPARPQALSTVAWPWLALVAMLALVLDQARPFRAALTAGLHHKLTKLRRAAVSLGRRLLQALRIA